MRASPLANVLFLFFTPQGIACFGIFSRFCVRLNLGQTFTRNWVLFLLPKRRTFLAPCMKIWSECPANSCIWNFYRLPVLILEICLCDFEKIFFQFSAHFHSIHPFCFWWQNVASWTNTIIEILHSLKKYVLSSAILLSFWLKKW